MTSSAAIVVQAMAAAKRYMGRSPSARIDEARPLAHSSREGSERTTTLVRANRATEALKIRIWLTLTRCSSQGILLTSARALAIAGPPGANPRSVSTKALRDVALAVIVYALELVRGDSERQNVPFPRLLSKVVREDC